MSTTGTNDFIIANVASLKTRYKLWQIKGLNHDSERDRVRNEYYQNCQNIIKKLSFQLQQPVTIIERDGVPHLVVPEQNRLMPTSHPLVKGRRAYFEPLSETFEVDYTKRSPDNDKICLRFLEFMIQTPLRSHPDLWQTKSGSPFFKRIVENQNDRIIKYHGFSVRPVIAPNGGLALRVHLTSKNVSRDPAPSRIPRNESWQYKKKHFIYHYGYKWYEIEALGVSELNVSQYRISINQFEDISLLECALRDSKKPIPPELATVNHDSSAFVYYNNRDEDRAAISSLCYQVFGPHDPEAKQLHQESILPPRIRQGMPINIARRYLSRLKFGDAYLEVETNPIEVSKKIFLMPDIQFRSKVLSVRGTSGALQTTLEELGSQRLQLLKDKRAGFYGSKPLGRQYFIVPLSIFESWGGNFLKGLRSEVDNFLQQEKSYEPIIVTYNDYCPYTYPDQGKAILKAVNEKCNKPGHAVVMVHHLHPRKNHEEDALAAMVIRELLERCDVKASVIHTSVGKECYIHSKNFDNEPEYVPHSRKRGLLSGYSQLVALNKVLLLNECWPYILATPLHADLVIGIDVKQNTAGFILIDKFGKNIRTLLSKSEQKERLRDDQIEARLLELINAEMRTRRGELLHHLVIHRDGKIWDSEIAGIQRAFQRLKRASIFSEDATLTILEIRKSASTPFRLFEITKTQNGTQVENPQIGHWEIRGNDGYICSTGRAFPHPGTTQPLHVRKIEGEMPLENCLEDIFFLCSLSWTKPDDCSRDPISIKLLDRFLGDEATKYDASQIEYSLSIDTYSDEDGEEAMA